MPLNTELGQALSAEREEGTLEHTFLRTLPSLPAFSSTTLLAPAGHLSSPRTQAVVFHLPSHWAGPEVEGSRGFPQGPFYRALGGL